jgi:hypothetical protein
MWHRNFSSGVSPVLHSENPGSTPQWQLVVCTSRRIRPDTDHTVTGNAFVIARVTR